MAPFWMANSLVLITPALAGINFLSDQRGELRAARICGALHGLDLLKTVPGAGQHPLKQDESVRWRRSFSLLCRES